MAEPAAPAPVVEVPAPDTVRLLVALLDPLEGNPQQMSGGKFAKLVESIRELGVVEPAFVSGPYPDGRYKIIGGHHRVDAVKVLGWLEVPCVVKPPMSDTALKLLCVKMNRIKGDTNPWLLTEMINELRREMAPEAIFAAMAITSETERTRLYKDQRATLERISPDLAKQLDKAKARGEITTVESLARTIQRLIAEHGHELDCGFIVFQRGGKARDVIVKMTPRTAANVDRLCREAKARKVDVNLYVNRHLERDLPDGAFAPAGDGEGR